MTAMQLTIPNWEIAKGKPCCAVLACAVAAQRPFLDAWGWMCRQKTKRWRGSMYDREIKALLEHLGAKCRPFQWSNKLNNSEADLRGMPLERFGLLAMPGTLYLVVTTGHAQTLLNGVVMDQRGLKPLAEFWGRRKKIRYVLEVVPPAGQDPATFGLPLFDYYGEK